MSQWIKERKAEDYVCMAGPFLANQKALTPCVGARCMHWEHADYRDGKFQVLEVICPYDGAVPYGRCGLSSK